MTKGNLEIKFFRPKDKKVWEMAAQFEKVVRKSFFQLAVPFATRTQMREF